MTKVVTLVPYRPSGDRHRWLWDQTRPALEHLGWPVFVGEPSGDAWSRAQAVNAAAKAARDAVPDWEVAFVADCDTIPDPDSPRRALWWLLDTGIGAVRPHLERAMLNEKGTLAFVQRGPSGLDRKAHFNRSHQGGGLLLVTREAFDGVGGYDESFIGWGYEDSDFNLRVLRHYGWDRLPGVAWHLFHPTDDNRPSNESRTRYRKLMTDYTKDIARWSAGRGLARPSAIL